MRTIGRLLLSAIFLVWTGFLGLAAKYAPALVFSFYPELSRKALSLISSVTSAMPLAVWEILAGLAVLWLLYTFVRIFTQRRSILCWLAGIVLGVCAGLFVFVALWGLNHFGPTVGEQLELSVREYTKEELTAATKYYAEQVSRLSASVSRDEQGLARISDFETLSKKAGAGYDALSQKYTLFTGSHDLLHRRGLREPGHLCGLASVYHVPRNCPPADRCRRRRRKLLRVSCVHGKQQPGISVLRRDRGLCILPQRTL